MSDSDRATASPSPRSSPSFAIPPSELQAFAQGHFRFRNYAPFRPLTPSVFQNQPLKHQHDHQSKDDRAHHVTQEMRTSPHPHDPDDNGKGSKPGPPPAPI